MRFISLRIGLGLVAATVISSSAAPVFADPLVQATSASISDVTVLNDPSVQITPEDEVAISLRIQNDGPVEGDFNITILMTGPDGSLAYNSESEGEDIRRVLRPGESNSVIFLWIVDEDALEGSYSITAILRDDKDKDIIYDARGTEENPSIEVVDPPKIFLSEDTWDFGVLAPGDPAEIRIVVTNEGSGTLEWEIARAPAWVEIDRPTEKVIGRGSIRALIRANAPLGALGGSIDIRSNGGTANVLVSGTIMGNPNGAISGLGPVDPTFRQGTDAMVEVSIQNTGDVDTPYIVILIIEGPTGAEVYNSNETNEDIVTNLNAGRNRTVNFFWPIPPDAHIGEYEVKAELRHGRDFDERFDRASGPTFTLRRGPQLSFSPASADFGTITQGDEGIKLFRVSNSGGGLDLLTWNVVRVPVWLELVGETSGVESGLIKVQLRQFPPLGELEDFIEVDSNSGLKKIPLTINVLAPPTSTPTRTFTPAPTRTHTPTRTPRPTVELPTRAPAPSSTPTPTLTRTPVPTLTPTRTAIARASRITGTPTPTLVPVPTFHTGRTAIPTPEGLVFNPPSNTSTPRPTSTPGGFIVLEDNSGGTCGAPSGNVSMLTSLANVSLMLGPVAMIMGYRHIRRRDED